MSSGRVAKIERNLQASENALYALLKVVLPRVCESGEPIFYNSAHLPETFKLAWLPTESEELLELASLTISLREQLGWAVPGSLGQLYLAACAEAMSTDEHRRGPRALAISLLERLPLVHQT